MNGDERSRAYQLTLDRKSSPAFEANRKHLPMADSRHVAKGPGWRILGMSVISVLRDHPLSFEVRALTIVSAIQRSTITLRSRDLRTLPSRRFESVNSSDVRQYGHHYNARTFAQRGFEWESEPPLPRMPAWAVQPAPSSGHGAIDPFKSTAAGQCAVATRGLLLCAACVCRSDHKRGQPDLDAGPGLCLDARYS